MRVLARLASLGRNLLRGGAVDQQLRAELEAHLELLADQKVRQGMAPAEARRQARLEMGGIAQVAESVRDVRAGRPLEDLWRDLRYGARTLRRSPGFTAVVVVTIALGIGVNDAIFRLVNALWLRPLPVPDPAGLVLLSDGDQPGQRFMGQPPMSPPGRLFLYSYPLYQRLGGLTETFAGLAAQESASTPSLIQASGPGEGAGGGMAERADGRAVSASYFDVLGVRADRGRTFSAQDETAPGANPVLVLSHGFWQRRFGGDPALLGARVTVNGTPHTVVGITPPGFTGAEIGSVTDFWVPLTMQAQLTRFGLDTKDRLFLVCIGLYGLIAQWAAQRTWEIGVRMALGATTATVRWLVLRQALTLVLAGLTLGLPAAALAAHLLQKLLYGITPLDPTALTLASLTLLTVAMLAAYLPAHRASRIPPMAALRAE